MHPAPTVWFDVEDLLHHYRSGHARFSGIQRLAFEVYRAAQATDQQRVRFLRHGREGEPPLVPIAWRSLEEIHISVRCAAAAATLAHQAPEAADNEMVRNGPAARIDAPVLPPPPSLRRAAAEQAEAIACLGRFGLALGTYPVQALARRARSWPAPPPALPVPRTTLQPPSSGSFQAEARPGDVLLTLGSPWFVNGYARIVRRARDDGRLRFGALIHDLIPINRPEWCDEGVVRTFREWHQSVIPLSDLVLANSHATAHDVEAWASGAGIRLQGCVVPIPIGTGFQIDDAASGPRPPGWPRPGGYVLFVSTLEARKNHALAVRVWRDLLEEERRGLRAPHSVPQLVFAGKVGWLASDLMQQLENASWFDGCVRLVRDPTDAELKSLYENCLFSIFPSWHEGWGLPVTEALALGVPVLSSSGGALPEAGGGFARYFDPGDTGACRRAVAALLDDPAALAAWRADIRARFRPTPWSETVSAVLEAAQSIC